MFRWTLLLSIMLLTLTYGHDNGLSVLVIGDSNTEYGLITQPFADTLHNYFGIDAMGTGYIPFNASFYAIRNGLYKDVSIDYSTALWTMKDMFEGTRLATVPYLSPNGHWLMSSKEDAVVTVKCPGNGIDVYWLSHSTGGDFTITIDDVIYDTISTAGETSVRKISITGLSTGQHTVRFKVITVPEKGDVTLLGFDARSDIAGQSKRSVVHNWGNGYCTTADFCNIDSTIFISGLQQCAPDVVVILLGTNDHFQDRRSAVEFKENLKALINRVKASEVITNILLVSTFMTSETTGKTFLPQYQATSWPEAAAETGIEYWDMCAWFGPYNTAQMSGSVHCNAVGGKLIGIEMLNRILHLFPPVHSLRDQILAHNLPCYSLQCMPGMLVLKQQKNQPHQIDLFTVAGRRAATLQGHGSHAYLFDRGELNVAPGVFIATLNLSGYVSHLNFGIVK